MRQCRAAARFRFRNIRAVAAQAPEVAAVPVVAVVHGKLGQPLVLEVPRTLSIRSCISSCAAAMKKAIRIIKLVNILSLFARKP